MASSLPMMVRAVALVPTPVDVAGLWPKPSTAGAKRHGCSPKTVASVDFCKKRTPKKAKNSKIEHLF